jgi:hypothetical protein
VCAALIPERFTQQGGELRQYAPSLMRDSRSHLMRTVLRSGSAC